MCQSLDEGGKRCPSCDVLNRRGKDRAAYKAKKLSKVGAVSTPSISQMELARAGVRVEENLIASGLSGNTDFLFKLAAVRKNIKVFEMQRSRGALGGDEVLELVTIRELESSVRDIGAIIDARARRLVNIDASEIARVKKELDQLLVIERKKSKAKLNRIRKGQGDLDSIKVPVSTDVDTDSQTIQSEESTLRKSKGNFEGSDLVVSMIKEKLFVLESGATGEVLGLLNSLKNGYWQALSEVRRMGLEDSEASEGLLSREVKNFFPSSWLENIRSTLNPSSNDSTSSLTFRNILASLQNIIPIVPTLEKEFVNRRGRVSSSIKTSGNGNQEYDKLPLEPYGIEESWHIDYVIEGYFIDRFIGKVPASRGQTNSQHPINNNGLGFFWEVLACGLEAISGQRLHLGGLVGVGPGRSRHDDDMRQFILGVLAVLEI